MTKISTPTPPPRNKKKKNNWKNVESTGELNFVIGMWNLKDFLKFCLESRWCMNFTPEIFVPGAPYATAYVCSPLKHAVYAVRVPFLALNLDRPVSFLVVPRICFWRTKVPVRGVLCQERTLTRSCFKLRWLCYWHVCKNYILFFELICINSLCLLSWIAGQGRRCQMPFGCGPYEDPKESTCLEPSWNFAV